MENIDYRIDIYVGRAVVFPDFCGRQTKDQIERQMTGIGGRLR